jgi:hypothetical protein
MELKAGRYILVPAHACKQLLKESHLILPYAPLYNDLVPVFEMAVNRGFTARPRRQGARIRIPGLCELHPRTCHRVRDYEILSQVSRTCGLSRVTLTKGVSELQTEPLTPGRIHHEGGGRHALTFGDPGLVPALDGMVEPTARGTRSRRCAGPARVPVPWQRN